MAKSKGVVVKARGGMFTFAAGLPDEEVCYLHSVVKSALSGRSHASEGNLRQSESGLDPGNAAK
jgi:hypothetical protein